ncbi:MAG: methionine--tRNA ligase [Ruminococcaceae bacterium]|nr:methionine--tRNA ligase [Oscillospiraceae bacterium]
MGNFDKNNRRYWIGGAWPYANNSLHVGHLAALLPGDVIARYGRLAGYDVIYVSGTDCHGTPITERAKREKCTPESIAQKYHEEFTRDFNDLLFTYDKYSATFTEYHKEEVKNIFKKIYDNGYLYEQLEDQDYCETCGQFLADRELEGECPSCHKVTRGDQCEFCTATFDAKELTNKHCRTCHNPTVVRQNKHLVFKLSAFQDKISQFASANEENWRWNAVNETKKYLTQGLPDRVATRDLTWGVEVPFEGYDDKRIYVWLEAVLGYCTTCKLVCENNGMDYESFISNEGDIHAYFIHGKDNIPFHTVIFPALLAAISDDIQLPTHIVSSEYMNMNDEKMSKSKGNIISVHSLAEKYPADAIRFYTILFNPERRDANFAIPEMIQTYNKFLVGGFGNFVNRNLSFLKKKFDSVVPEGTVDPEIKAYVEGLYESIGNKIDAGELRSAAEEMVTVIQYANKYYDESKPWVAAKEDAELFGNITASCIYLMANMANLFNPLIPQGTEILAKMLGITPEWKPVEMPKTFTLGEIEMLYKRIDEE